MFPVLKRHVLIDIHFKNPCFLTDKALKSTALQLKLWYCSPNSSANTFRNGSLVWFTA